MLFHTFSLYLYEITDMKALSIKNPWGFLLALGIKNIENRTWKTNYRGKVLIHISSTIDPRFKYDAHCFTKEQLEKIAEYSMKDRRFETSADFMHNKGCIIGEFDLVDCVIGHDSIWAEKSPEGYKPIYNWVIENPVYYDEPIKNVVGSLNLWNYEK